MAFTNHCGAEQAAMPRTKNYMASEACAAKAISCPGRADEAKPCADDARVDMTALLKQGARFGGPTRTLDLRAWLGRGIDAWVFATTACLRAMLLSGARETESVATYFNCVKYLFAYLTTESQMWSGPRPQAPSELVPLHIQHFVGWLQKLAQGRGWSPASTHSAYRAIKAVIFEMFAQGFIAGEPFRLFPRGTLTWCDGGSRQTSLSDAEQERLAKAIKSDLVAIHHGRLALAPSVVQAIRLLVVAHRQGLNLTPLLEMRRDALMPGLLPGTIRIQTVKHRSKKIRWAAGRAAPSRQPSEDDILLDLSEGAVLQQAIACTRDLVVEAPAALKNRIWLYRAARSKNVGRVTCLTANTLQWAIRNLIQRHRLLGDDGKRLRINLSRLRKSRFDRALRAADGDMAITANLMGNTPRVAAMNYPSMNYARQAEAAAFMNSDYTAMMRAAGNGGEKPGIWLHEVRPFSRTKDRSSSELPSQTPVSSCMDTIGGEHAPKDGHSHCDRYVMCLFCSSFAIVGTVDELWRLFSFQKFARSELDYMDDALGAERTENEHLEELRDRYRLTIPYIDDFTQRQFARSRVARARAKTEAGLHPYWRHQMTMSRRARSGVVTVERGAAGQQGDAGTGDRVGT